MWVSGFVAAVFLLGFANSQPSGCKVFPNRHLGRNSRLLLVPNSSALDGYRFLLPHAGQKFLSLQQGQQLVLACPSLGNRAPVVFRARCLTGNVVQMSKPPVNRTISKIPCRREPRPVLRIAGRCAGGTLPLLGAGFLLGKRQLVRILDVCHDSRRVNTLWVRFTLMQGVEDARQKNVPRAPFLCTRHFGNLTRSFDKLYDPSFQHSHFQKILGIVMVDKTWIYQFDPETKRQSSIWVVSDDELPVEVKRARCAGKRIGSAEDAGRYINESADMFLVRGMLASHHDFVYYAQQKVSSFCVNTAPMWHNISVGEWRQLGISLRRFASRQGTDLTVYSGTFGQLRFAENRQVIRLGQIIVPAMFWKLVYDRLTFRGIVFVVDNRPLHLEERGPPACHDVCRQIASSWFDNMSSLNTSGRVHCCSVHEFLDSTRVLPEFRDTVYSMLV